jgi:hypothetical protein
LWRGSLIGGLIVVSRCRPTAKPIPEKREESKMTEEEILKLRLERTKKDAGLLRLQTVYAMLNMEFYKSYCDEKKHGAINDLRRKFEDLLKEIMELED